MHIVVLLLAAVLLHGVAAQISFNTQVMNSGFITPSCNPSKNLYNFGFVNSMDAGSDVVVTLSCSGAPPVALKFFAVAKDPVPGLFIAPQAPYSVANTPCTLSATIRALNSSDPTATLTLGVYISTCGQIPSNQFDQFVPGCAYIDMACNIQNGHALRYGPFMIIVMSSIYLMLCGAGVAVGVTSEQSKIKYEAKKHDFVANGVKIQSIYTDAGNPSAQRQALAPARMLGSAQNTGVSPRGSGSSSSGSKPRKAGFQ